MIRRTLTLVREGVYSYRGIPVYKPWSELTAWAKIAKPVPVTIEHPHISEDEILLSSDPAKYVRENFPTYGQVEDFKANHVTHEIEGVMKLDDNKLIIDGHGDLARKFRSGVASAKGISGGFIFRPVTEKGEYNGREYWQKQTNYQVNHVALTSAPRIPYAMLHGSVGADAKDGTWMYAVDSMMLGNDKRDSDFEEIYQKMLQKSGLEKGRQRYYRFLNAYGFKDSLPMSHIVNQTAIRKMVAARKKRKNDHVRQLLAPT